MSTTSTPPLYASPIARTPSHMSPPPHATASGSGSKSGTPKPKPVNVFTNDGSFLERFQRLQKDEEEKKKQEEILARKRMFDNRFKNRGKRPTPDSPASPKETPPDPPAKKPKTDEPMTQYQKEVKSYSGHGLKDDGIGVRPLVK